MPWQILCILFGYQNPCVSPTPRSMNVVFVNRVQQCVLTMGAKSQSFFGFKNVTPAFTCRLPVPSYLRVKHEVFRCAHVLGVWVRFEVDAGGVLSVGAASDCWGNVSTGEIHVRWAVKRVVQPHHVRGVRAEVGWVLERKRAGNLRLLVDHLEKKNTKLCYRKRFQKQIPHVIRCRNKLFLPPGESRSDFLIPLTSV